MPAHPQRPPIAAKAPPRGAATTAAAKPKVRRKRDKGATILTLLMGHLHESIDHLTPKQQKEVQAHVRGLKLDPSVPTPNLPALPIFKPTVTPSPLVRRLRDSLGFLTVKQQEEVLAFIRTFKRDPSIPEPNGTALVRLMKKAEGQNLFSHIKDPVAWQREMRKDRPLPGRE